MSFCFPHGQPHSDLAVAAQAAHQAGVPEDDRHDGDENHQDQPRKHFHHGQQVRHPRLAGECVHDRRKFIGVVAIGRVKSGHELLRFLVSIQEICEKTEDLSGGVLHIKGRPDGRDIGDHRPPVHGLHSEADRSRHREIGHGHAALHGDADQGGGIPRLDLQAAGDFFADEDIRGLLRHAAPYQDFLQLENSGFDAPRRQEVYGQAHDRSLIAGLPLSIGDVQ